MERWDRRRFIRSVATGAGLACCAPLLGGNTIFSKRKKNILVLGGTNFLGPAVVNSLLARQHRVTLFNRGITNPHLFPQLPRIRGDREEGLAGYHALQDGNWDIVIDVWPNDPDLVESALQTLRERTDHYIFVSSIAAYRSFKKTGIKEDDPLYPGEDRDTGDYRLNKSICERLVRQYFPQRHTIVRPGVICGERGTGSFAEYIVKRLHTQDEILAPDSNDPVQIIDVKDVGKFITRCCEHAYYGAYNAVGPKAPLGYKEMLLKASRIIGSETKIHWVPPNFLLEDVQLQAFSDILLWIPVATDPEPGFFQISNAKAIRHGLRFRPFKKTVADTLATVQQPEKFEIPTTGLSPERERQIIRQWLEVPASGD